MEEKFNLHETVVLTQADNGFLIEKNFVGDGNDDKTVTVSKKQGIYQCVRKR